MFSGVVTACSFELYDNTTFSIKNILLSALCSSQTCSGANNVLIFIKNLKNSLSNVSFGLSSIKVQTLTTASQLISEGILTNTDFGSTFYSFESNFVQFELSNPKTNEISDYMINLTIPVELPPLN